MPNNFVGWLLNLVRRIITSCRSLCRAALICLLCGCANVALSQSGCSQLDPKQPLLFVAYERVDKNEIWLSLHNNTNCAIQIEANELVIIIRRNQDVPIPSDEVALTLHVENFVARLPESALRDLVDRLPPELLH